MCRVIGEEAKEVITLHNLIYHRPRTEDEFLWLYHRNPRGPSTTWFAIDQEKGTTVGARPVFPWRMKILDAQVVVTQAGDALTHPDYRGLGIFTALVKAAWSELRQQAIPITYSFSVDGSLSVYRKVKIGPEPYTGCHEIGFFRRMVRPLQLHELLVRTFGRNVFSKCLSRASAVLLRLPLAIPACNRSRPLIIKELRHFDRRFDVLWERASTPYKVLTVRDCTFLNWRYINTPSKRHIVLSAEEGKEVLGFAVFEIGESVEGSKEGHLVEVFAIADPRVVRSLLTAVMKYCLKHNVSKISAWSLEGSDYARTLRRAGFIPRPDRLSFAVHIHADTPYAHVLLDSKNWFVTLGDRDLETVSH